MFGRLPSPHRQPKLGRESLEFTLDCRLNSPRRLDSHRRRGRIWKGLLMMVDFIELASCKSPGDNS